MATSGSSAGSPSGSPSGSPGRKARSLALLLLLLCGAAGLALWATRPPSDVPTSTSSSTPGPATPPSARPGDLPLAGSGRPPSSPPATTPDAATDAGDAPSTPSAPELLAAPLPRTPVRVIVRQDGRPVADAGVSLDRVGDAEPSPSGLRSGGVRVSIGRDPLTLISEWMTPPVAEDRRRRFHVSPVDPVVARTGRDGVLVTELAAGSYAVRVRRDDAGVASFGFVEADIQGQDEVTIEISLNAAVRVEGIVVDRDGLPVPDVPVQTWAASDTGIERASARLVTGTDGRFALLGFGREAHVVAVFGSVASPQDGTEVSDERPSLPPGVAGTKVTVAPGELRDVRIVVDRVEPTVVEMRGARGRGYGVNDFPPQPVEPGVWVMSGGWGSMSFGERAASTVFVVVPEGTGCPWYVGRPADRAPFVLARQPGGLRVVTLTPARVVAGTLAADPRAGHVRGFLRAPNGDRVEFGVVAANQGAGEAGGEGAVKPSPRTWKFVDAPSDNFDVAAYEGNIRRGPWVEVRAGTDAVEGLLVPVDAPPPSAPAPPAEETLPR